jgi:hypothetical protein
MNPALRSFMISSPIALHFSSMKRRRRCFTDYDLGLMFDFCSATSLGILGFPGKHIKVRFEEVDERAFLFRIERRPDTEHTTAYGDDRILDILDGLKRARRSLGRLGDILVLGSRLDAEPLGPVDCLSKLKAFNVALICALIRRPFGPGIFSFRYV